MKRQTFELEIRDYLADNLDFIEPGLTLIKKEFNLPNKIGTSGYIDILAKDQLDNLVVIEIKRSDVAARQAITEICKYVGLLKRHLHIKNSEIRVLIISTEWKELLVPYSEFYHSNHYNVEAYQISLNDAGLPESKRQIHPLEDIRQRSISPIHEGYWCNTQQLRDHVIQCLRNSLQALGIYDFLLVEMLIDDTDAIFPYGIYVAHQSLSINTCKNIIKAHADKLNKYAGDIESEVEMVEAESTSLEFLHYLEGEVHSVAYFISALQSFSLDMEIESSSPEKFRGWVERGYWKIGSIHKHGLFLDDFRLSDEKLILELEGYSGASNTWYFAVAQSKLRAKVEEILTHYSYCLEYNPYWREQLGEIIHYVIKKGSECNITISIFNTENILESLYLMCTKDYYAFVPKFYLIIDPVDTDLPLEIFHGVLKWKKKDISITKLINQFFKSDPFVFFLYSTSFAIFKDNHRIMNSIGVKYSIDYYQVINDDLKVGSNIAISHGQIKQTKSSGLKEITSFFDEQRDFVYQLIQLYNFYHRDMAK